MSEQTLHTNFARAYEDGATFYIELVTSDDILTVHPLHIADLVLTTGQIVACDPFVFSDDTPPFTHGVAPGTYPVTLSVATIGPGHERVACAKVQLRDAAPVRWEMAVLPGQDIATLEEGYAFAYPVDAGTGCFGDRDALAALNERQNADHDQRYFEEISEAIDSHYPHWADISFGAKTAANCVMFSSGWGDGLYSCWWGYDEAGNIVCLVTDFNVLPND
jgi:hypothetical protein